ncbi:hypothetical protein MES5069_760033 [Mesorhizobium escarrei]|uniref:Uncharacterized protein n=1 Tax=Mesorhizobium escarrei TaxID=666018 RepID=A0ABN8KIS3_9HYPH|nr:hypothetical protein MES5069_760033 [Mesorhizobium escarrei]
MRRHGQRIIGAPGKASLSADVARGRSLALILAEAGARHAVASHVPTRRRHSAGIVQLWVSLASYGKHSACPPARRLGSNVDIGAGERNPACWVPVRCADCL